MPVTQIGLVYYADDPHKRVFRRVYPEFSNAELDQPPTDGKRAVMRQGDSTPHTWTSFGVDAARPVAMDKAASDAGRKHGSPTTPKTEPVVYYINWGNVPAAQLAAATAFVAAGSTWMNFINLGAGVPATLLASVTLISPSWVVVVDGSPGVGSLLRQQTFGGHTVGVWVV